MKILGWGENFGLGQKFGVRPKILGILHLHLAFCILHFAFCICILYFAFCILHFAFCILHLHLHFAFAFCIFISNLNFPRKFGIFPIHIFLNFLPKNLDVIVVGVVVVVVGGHGDNSGTSFNWHFSVKPIQQVTYDM